MAKRVIIIQFAEPVPGDQNFGTPMRGMNLLKSLNQSGCHVDFITNSFFHTLKCHRYSWFQTRKMSDVDIHFIPSIGYRNHLGIRRVCDNIILGILLLRYVSLFRKANSVFIGYPPLFPSLIASLIARIFGVKYILDVKDKWPDTFVRAGVPSFIIKLLRRCYSPAFKNARHVSSISSSYSQWTKDFGAQDSFVSYLTKETTFAKNIKSIKKTLHPRIKIVFVGSFIECFDFDVLNIALNSDIVDIKLFGEGPRKPELLNKYGSSSNIKFFNFIDEERVRNEINKAHFSLAPYKDLEDFRTGIPNKIFDAISLKTPIITSLLGEGKRLIDKFNCGISYTNSQDLNKLLKDLTEEKYREMIFGINEANDFFNHESNYFQITKRLL